MDYTSFYPNRTICEVLNEMRKCYKTRNFAGLLGMIEEAQTMANRMEAALYDQKDVENALKRKAKLKKEIKDLENQLELLNEIKETRDEQDSGN